MALPLDGSSAIVLLGGAMKVVTMSEIPTEVVKAPLFTEGDITRQTPFPAEAHTNMNFGIVNFGAGTRN